MKRRDFLKVVVGGAGLATVGLGSSLEAFAAAQEDIDAKRLRLFRQLDTEPFQVREGYKRFNSTHYGFNSVPRESGTPWTVAGNKALTQHVLAGRMSKDVKAPSVGMARVYAGVHSALWAPCTFFGRTGQGTENMGALSWSDLTTLQGLRREERAPDITDPGPLTLYTKAVARLSGAELVGIAPFDIRWVYTHTQRNQFSPEEAVLKEIRVEDAAVPYETDQALIIPADVQSVVMMGFSMNQTLMRTSASPVASGIAGLGYLRMGVSAVAVAEFIRTQGYWAIPSTNCTAANVPIAIQAGLGEDGRHGVLVTPEFGASLRLAKVFTNMPMIKAKPISFGLREFCDSCGKCANDCPADALATGPRGWDAIDECNNPGVFKYYNAYKKCLRYWMENGCSCSTCVATCQGDLWAYGNVSKDPEWLAENMDFVNAYWAARSSEPGYWRGVADPAALWDMELPPYGLHQYSEHFKNREEFKNRLRSYQGRK